MENEKNNQSIVNAAMVASGFLAYYVSSTLFETFAGMFGAVARWHAVEIYKHGIPVGFGLLIFLLMFLSKNVHVFLDEAIVEVRKVVWPSRKDTVAMTIVCCVMVVVAGIGFGLFDLLASQLVKMFVN